MPNQAALVEPARYLRKSTCGNNGSVVEIYPVAFGDIQHATVDYVIGYCPPLGDYRWLSQSDWLDITMDATRHLIDGSVVCTRGESAGPVNLETSPLSSLAGATAK